MGEVKYKSIPGAVLGIIGAVFAIIGGLLMAMCAEIVDGMSGVTDYTWAAYVFGLGSGVVALVGAILDFKNNIIGGILMIVSIGMIIAICIIMFFSWALIVALVLIGVGVILSFAVRKPVN